LKRNGLLDRRRGGTAPTAPTDGSQGEDVFECLRGLALGTTPERLGLSLPADEAVVYGVVMDWAVGNGVATTVAFSTGDASLYFSSGGGIIGGGGHEGVGVAARRLVEEAQSCLGKAAKSDSTPLPGKGEVRFYLLANTGVFLGEGRTADLEGGLSEWSGVFDRANGVITEIRRTAEG